MYIHKHIIACGYSKCSLSQHLSSKLWQCSSTFLPTRRLAVAATYSLTVVNVLYYLLLLVFSSFFFFFVLLLQYLIFGFHPNGARMHPSIPAYVPSPHIHIVHPSVKPDTATVCLLAVRLPLVPFVSFRTLCLVYYLDAQLLWLTHP